MFWIIEYNIFNEPRYEDVLGSLDRAGIEFARVLSFEDVLEPEPKFHGRVGVIGSYTLVRLARKRGWQGGIFTNANFDYEVYAPVFGSDLLNEEARLMRLGEVSIDEPSFIRPVADGKTFGGRVVQPHKFDAWRDWTARTAHLTGADADTRVIVAPLKVIHGEYRYFVVDNQIVAASRYKLAGRLSMSDDIALEATRTAERMIARWQPDRAFVIDVALTDAGPKLIEFNCINSAGWYMADVSRVVQAIDALF